MNKQNLHIHTTYADGKDSPEEILLEAIERGFDSVGFSEHAFLPYSSYPNQMTEEKAARYKKEIRELKQKYSGAIDVFCGLEFDFYSELDTEGYDYQIGSVHYLACKDGFRTFDRGLADTLDYIEAYFDGSSLAFAKAYYETVARLPEMGRFDVIGHFDLITKNNEQNRFLDTSEKEYLCAGFEAIHALKGQIPLFEVNTGAVSRGYRTQAYPQIEFLREFRACGFGAIITSDCHDKNFLDCGFEDAAELLSAAGFTSKWILGDGGFREVAL